MSTLVAQEYVRHERDLFLAALERLTATDFNANHEEADWDTAAFAVRFAHCTAMGLDATTAHAIVHYLPTIAQSAASPPAVPGDCVHCSTGSGIRCCEQARDR